jgi:hypothetical protein
MCAISVAFHYGLGKHDYDFTSFDEMVTVLKWSWIQMIPGCCTSILARISAAILLINIFGVRRWFRMYLLILTPLQTIGAIVVILVNWLQVSPVEGLWNPTIAVRHLDSRVALYTAYVGQCEFVPYCINCTHFGSPYADQDTLQHSLHSRTSLTSCFQPSSSGTCKWNSAAASA